MKPPADPSHDWSLALLEGAIDMHAHTAPALFPRPIYDTDLAKVALDSCFVVFGGDGRLS